MDRQPDPTVTDDLGDEAEDADYTAYTSDELLAHAQGNAQALFIATAAYLQSQGQSVDAWVNAVGATFVSAWDTSSRWDADEFMDAMLINFRSIGAEVVSAEFAAERSEATVQNFPDTAALAQFGVDAALGDRYNDIATPIARALGLAWSWTRDGETIRYTATRVDD